MMAVYQQLLLLIALFCCSKGESAGGRRVISVRICDGPSCMNMGSIEIANLFDSMLTEVPRVDDDDSTTLGFEVGFKSCYNSCKRSINVGCIPQGGFEGDLIVGMNDIERAKRCFMKVNDEVDVKRVVEIIRIHYGVPSPILSPKEKEMDGGDGRWGVSYIGQDVCGSKYNDDPFSEQQAKPDAWDEFRKRAGLADGAGKW